MTARQQFGLVLIGLIGTPLSASIAVAAGQSQVSPEAMPVVIILGVLSALAGMIGLLHVE